MEVNVACDTCMKDNMVLATGEITTSGRIGPGTVARKCCEEHRFRFLDLSTADG